MKSVMLSIKPYWLFLIIAKTMGWKTDKQKTIEVRKSCPKDKNWNKTVILYCTKDKVSLNLIPKEYRPLMERFLEKFIGEFVCDEIYNFKIEHLGLFSFDKDSCLPYDEMNNYVGDKTGYGWHISDLKIYSELKEISEFGLKRPPQSWCYVEELK